MRDTSLLIVTLGAILVSVCSTKTKSFDEGDYDEPVRMASESLVVKSYKDTDSSTVSTTTSHGNRFEEYQIYQGVMGRPGIDFPVYPNIPATSFSCRGVKKSGYYADLATDCQVFHICDGNRKISFLCPNGTIFRQSHLICDWWFRVDCGKSVELYEESAEQLAADQKIYKARSEERERRRKLSKALAGENVGELTSSEVYALDEPFHIKSQKEQNRNDFASTTARTYARFDGRKSERNSKKVVDSGSTEKFPNYNREKQTTNRAWITDPSRSTKDRQQLTTTAFATKEPKVSFVEFTSTTPGFSTPVQKFRPQTQNSVNFEANKENIQPAESGSLVEDYNGNRNDNVPPVSKKSEQNIDFTRTQNFAFNSNKRIQEQQFNFNNGYNQNKRTDQINYGQRNSELAYNVAKKSQDPTTVLNRGQNFNSNDYKSGGQISDFGRNFGYNDKQRTDAAFNNEEGNSSFTYNQKQNNGQANDKVSNFAYTESAQQSTGLGNFGGASYVASDNKTSDQTYDNRNSFNYNQATSNGATSYTTEFAHYESKRTNPIERHETITPASYTTKTQSSKFRSSTIPYADQEKQFVAETASFAANRGSKSYFNYQNQFNTYDVGTTAAPNQYKTTHFQQTEKIFTTEAPLSSPKQNFNQYSTLADFYKMTTYRPVKQHSRKVTVFPSTVPQTTNNVWQTTTFQPWSETTTNDKFTAENVYFTTSNPDRELEIATENQNLGISQKEPELPTRFEFISSTQKPEIDITLQEVNINKGFASTESSNKSYEDFVREGLEVPPSSGPNALRSFALYFAANNNNNDYNNNNYNYNNTEEEKTTSYLQVTGEGDSITTTLNPFQLKKKEVLKQVDELVQGTAVNATEQDIVHNDNTLPNSLTPHTKESYSALFSIESAQNQTDATAAEKAPEVYTGTNFETTAFEYFTEEPHKINKELIKNDLDGSQTRGLVEPDPNSDADYSKVSPDLRELAQVFTKALSAYLDDPEAFRKVLSEIRPTEPTADSEVSSSSPIEYPSATQEDDEVLDFSDVTKASYKKKISTPSNFPEKATEYFTVPPTTNANDIENFVLPINHTGWATNIELTAPLLESLDQSQSSYYTAPPFVGTTNKIAEEINNEFTGNENLPPADSNEAIDSYFPIRGSVDDSSLPRYGGFQNNTQPTTKYSPYGAELTSTTYLPYGADLTSTTTPKAVTARSDNQVTTFNPNNVTSFFSHFSKNETQEGEVQLAKELNNLVLLQKFTTPRGNVKESTTAEPNLSTVHLATQNEINQYENVQLGNGEILEKNTREGKSLNFPETDINSNYFEPNPKEINLELSPPSSTPKGFLITYSLGSSSSERATYLPKATTPEIQPTTYSPNRDRLTTYPPEFQNLNQRIDHESFETNTRSATEYFTTVLPTTLSFAKSTNSLERLAELQETLMFNTNNLTTQQKDQARVSVEEMMDSLNVTDTTTNTLMKVMEMAAKNETYRRLVLLLVNDKSGRNKTVEEARVTLLKALLTPVINPQQTRTVLPISETARIAQPEVESRTNLRRSKSISETTQAVLTTTPAVTTLRAANKNSRRVKTSRGLARAESNYGKSGLGNLGLIRRTIENSKNKQVRINSLDDAILDSDSRAVELLKSLYSLAARWG